MKQLPKVAERLIRYAKYDTQSAYESNTYPSTSKQLILAGDLAKELEEVGLEDVHIEEFGFVVGTLPSNIDRDVPKIGFLAHFDTTPEFTGTDVKPQIIWNYNGNDIVLNKDQNIVLTAEQSPELLNYIGDTLITTDGTTLLGADDKAGIAEIITAIEYLILHPEIPHGTIKVAFTPDEEIGSGIEKFDIEKFDVNFAYTLDGGPIGELCYETFNGVTVKTTIKGFNVHPGLAKNKMVNAIDIFTELNSMLPANERPQYTENREGYFHALTITGDVEKIESTFYIRDHDRQKLKQRQDLFQKAVAYLNEKYGDSTIEYTFTGYYYNMGDKLKDSMHLVDIMEKAAKEVGLTPYYNPIRGGTDGSWLTEQGLPTPNIFTGGHNYHGKFEFIPVESMEKAVEVIVKIIELHSCLEEE